MINVFDIARIASVFIFIMSKSYDGEISFKAPDQIVPVMFFLVWVKITKYLSVFGPFRYLIMMLGEIIADIRTFLALLFIAMFAYGQIMLTMPKAIDPLV